MRRLLKNHKGVTMMEVMVTVAILGIVVAPCLSSFVIAQRGNVLAKQTYGEYTEAANVVETLKSLQVPEDSTWKQEMTNAIAAVQGIKDDKISVFGDFKSSDSYYEIRIYTGEHETEPEGQETILKGVIAP